MTQTALFAREISAPVWDNGSTTKSAPSLREQTWGDDHFQLRTSDRMTIVAPDPTSVYRYYDRAGLLLYVGITSRATSRQREHNGDKGWWPYVSTQDVEHHPTRLAALAREKELIRRYRPPFNRQHNPDHETSRALYVAAESALPEGGATLSPRDAYAAVGGKVPMTQIGSGSVAMFAIAGTFRDLLRAASPSPAPVLLLAPRKRGVMDSIDPYGELATVTFRDARGEIPDLRNAHLRLKVVTPSPFIVRIHEARAEMAA